MGPSYLINIFGKYRNIPNRNAALTFFEYVIKKIGKNKNNDLLDKLFCALITVIQEWKPQILTGSTMEEVIDLMNCIDNQSIDDNNNYLLNHWNKLFNSLKKLIINDFECAPNLPQ